MGVNSLPKTVTRQRRDCAYCACVQHANHSATEPPVLVLFSFLAVLDLRVGHTMDVLSPFISVLFHG